MTNQFPPKNVEIREARGRVPLWVIAEKLEIRESTLGNLIRMDGLSSSRKNEILKAIEEVKQDIKNRFEHGKGERLGE